MKETYYKNPKKQHTPENALVCSMVLVLFMCLRANLTLSVKICLTRFELFAKIVHCTACHSQLKIETTNFPEFIVNFITLNAMTFPMCTPNYDCMRYPVVFIEHIVCMGACVLVTLVVAHIHSPCFPSVRIE